MLRTLSRQVVGLLIGAALASFTVAPAHAGTLNLTGISCTSLVVSGGGSSWTVACTSMTCSLAASNSNPAPGSSITLTATCDSGANSYAYATTTGGCTTPSGSGTQATVSESAARNCTYQVTGTAGAIQGQATTAVSWSTGTPAAPTGCTESANQTSFTAAGGTINLSASCGTPTSGVVWSWTRNGAGGWSALQNPSEVLPANGGSGAVNYTYQAKACNGADSFGGANCTIITPQVSASVAGNGGGGISCSGFNQTLVLDIDWNNPQIVTTAGMGPNDIAVVRFTTGPNFSPPANPPKIIGAETGNTSGRFAALSETACDFSNPQLFAGVPADGAVTAGTLVSVPFSVGPNNTGYYPQLQTNKTYYFNVKNVSNPSCAATGNCNMFFNLNKPGGGY